MGIKITLVILLGASALLVYVVPKPSLAGDTTTSLYSQPLIARAASNISHTLLSDLFWLSAAGIGELSPRKPSVEETAAMARTITVLDPFFFQAVHYYATYLASVQNAPHEGAGVYQSAGMFLPDDFQLIFNEMVLRLTYEEPLDDDHIVALARRAMQLPDKERYVGAVDYAAMVEGMMYYAASRQQRNEKRREDLLWLMERTSNPDRKREIARQLGIRE